MLFRSTILVGYANFSPAVSILLILIVGLVCGGLIGAFIGWLKYRFNIHEVVSSIMINYIVSYAPG